MASPYVNEPKPLKNEYVTELPRAKLHLYLHQNDMQNLERGIREYQKQCEYRILNCVEELWHMSVLTRNSDGLILLSKMGTERLFKRPMNLLMNEFLSAEDCSWILSHDEVAALWCKETEACHPSVEWAVKNKLLPDSVEAFAAFQEAMRVQPESFHERMKAFILTHAMEALTENGRFLKTIEYYKEPTKKQVKVAATSKEPYLDIPRLEQYWPGFEALKQTVEGLGFNKFQIYKQLFDFLNKKSSTESPEVATLPDLNVS